LIASATVRPPSRKARPIAGWANAATPKIDTSPTCPKADRTNPERARLGDASSVNTNSAVIPIRPKAAPTMLAITWLARNVAIVT
jgi:hypothetical protein